MIASLPMYPADTATLTTFWQGLAQHLRARGIADVPVNLTVPDGPLIDHWRQPDLLFSQTCGYPLVALLTTEVRVIGAFHYTAPGTAGPLYCSHFIARADDPSATLADFAGRRVAFNGADSQSGMNCLRAAIAPLATHGHFFRTTIETGAHHRSMRAVADDAADLAAIDCISFALIARNEPDLAARLKILSASAAVPGLPLITRGGASDGEMTAIRQAVADAIVDPALASVRDAMLIDGFSPLDREDYAPILTMRDAAVAAGYPELA